MGKTLPILGIIATVLAALTALILVDIAPVAVAAFAIGAGIYYAISKDWRQMAPGIAAIVLGILGILGVIGSVGGEDGSVEFPITPGVGQALIVVAGLALAAASWLLTWRALEPEWQSYIWAGLSVVAVIVAFVFSGELGDQSQTGPFVVAVLCLANLGAPLMHLRRE